MCAWQLNRTVTCQEATYYYEEGKLVLGEKTVLVTISRNEMTIGGNTDLETINLIKSYNGRVVVDRVSLKIRAGEVVGLLGPNGAGKTTTFYMIIGLIKPDQGKVVFNGEDISVLPMYQRARRGITYLPQEPSVFRKLTVEENILAILETLNLPREEKQTRLEGLLKELNIAHLAKNKAYSLSGGERRRVEITRALVLAPSLILLDEPFAVLNLWLLSIQRSSISSRKRHRGQLLDQCGRPCTSVIGLTMSGADIGDRDSKRIAASKRSARYTGGAFPIGSGRSVGRAPAGGKHR
jgi:lipopolysaccharide export system ATP-binding protein